MRVHLRALDDPLMIANALLLSNVALGGGAHWRQIAARAFLLVVAFFFTFGRQGDAALLLAAPLQSPWFASRPTATRPCHNPGLTRLPMPISLGLPLRVFANVLAQPSCPNVQSAA